MIVSASKERMPVSAGSAGLRMDAVADFLRFGCNLAARSPVDVGALSSNNCIKLDSNLLK